jgi:endonuclease YncB( thermonuclease family)
VLAVLVLAAAACIAAALDQGAPPIEGRGRASDGDSFRLDGTRIRLLGLDAPELAQQCTSANGRQWPCGQSARDRMAALLSSGAVHCLPEETDQYGRLLATCAVDDGDLGATMVAEGLAISSGLYWTEEAEARRRNLGIWAGSFETPRTWRDEQAAPQHLFGWLSGLWP